VLKEIEILGGDRFNMLIDSLIIKKLIAK
jgi:hypothetical protein